MIYVISESIVSHRDIEEIFSILYPEYPLSHDILNDALHNTKELLPSFYSVTFPHDGGDIFLCTECTSTQDIAKILYKQGVFTNYSLLLSIEQHSGRGQYGRSWVSSRGNILATMCLPPYPCYMQSNTTVFLGASVTHFLRTLGVQAYNKWINDILLATKKVAGLLLEQEGECLLLGIGINLKNIPSLHNGLHSATSILQHMYFPYSPVACMHALREFFLMKENLLIEGSNEDVQTYIEKYMAYKGKTIGIEIRENEIQYGECYGIGDDGSLILIQEGTHTHYVEGHIVSVS